MSKQCSKCLKVKEFTEFYKSKTGKFGYRQECKECRKELRNKLNVDTTLQLQREIRRNLITMNKKLLEDGLRFCTKCNKPSGINWFRDEMCCECYNKYKRGWGIK